LATIFLIFFILFILFLFFWFLILILIPSCLNIFFSWIIAKKLVSSRSIFLKVTAFIFISFILGVNIRIPEIIFDVVNKTNQIKFHINEKNLAIAYGYPISILSDLEKIHFKSNPLGTVFVDDRGQGLPDIKLRALKNTEYDIKSEVRDKNLGIDHSNNSSVKIKIHGDKGKYISRYNISLYKDNELFSKADIDYRVSYRGDLYGKADQAKEWKIAEYIIHNNFWNWILIRSNVIAKPTSFVDRFLADTVKVRDNVIPEKPKIAQIVKIDNRMASDYVFFKKNKNYSNIDCDQSKINIKNQILFFNHNGIEKPIASYTYRVDRVLCLNDEIVFINIRTFNDKRDGTWGKISHYSYLGEHKNTYEFNHPKEKLAEARRFLYGYKVKDYGYDFIFKNNLKGRNEWFSYYSVYF
jgi:hypothetical protein